MRRYSNRRNSLTPKSMIYAVLLVVLMAGLGYLVFRSVGQKVPDALCCFDNVRQPQTYVLFDASEPRFNEQQARSLRIYLDRLYDNLAFNERLSVITSEGDQIASVIAPRFHVCGPAERPDQLEAIGAAPAQSGFLKKQKQRLYQKIVGPELDALLSLDPDPNRRQLSQSPILEMIADLSRLPSFEPESRIILVSDLIQNSDSAQFCRVQNDMPSFRTFKQRRVYARLKPNSLEGVKVEVLMLQRVGYGRTGFDFCSSEDEIRAFWTDYFTENGASVRFIRIRHGLIEG